MELDTAKTLKATVIIKIESEFSATTDNALQSKIVGAAPSLRREQIWQVEMNMMIIPQIWIYGKFSCVPLLDFYDKTFLAVMCMIIHYT